MSNQERRNSMSASSAPADDLCHGRHQAQQGLPDISGADAEFGKQIHAALATGLPEGLSAEQLSIYESCQEIEAKLVSQAFGPDASIAKIFREQRLWCLVPPNKLEFSGMPDVVYRHKEKGLVLEYKTLPGALPDSPMNLQLRSQVVLAARAYLLTDVAVAIIQPLVTHDPLVTVYDAAAITQAEGELWARVVASNEPNAPRTAGEKQCQFCKAKPTCKEYAAWAKTMLPAPVSIFDVPVAQWSPEQCATFCERMGFAAKWLEDVKSAMKQRIKDDPNAIPGWTLEEGNTIATIVKPQELFNRFTVMGGTLEQFMEAVKITKGKLEAQVRTVTQAKGKALNLAMKQLLDGLVEEKQNEPSLGRRKE